MARAIDIAEHDADCFCGSVCLGVEVKHECDTPHGARHPNQYHSPGTCAVSTSTKQQTSKYGTGTDRSRKKHVEHSSQYRIMILHGHSHNDSNARSQRKQAGRSNKQPDSDRWAVRPFL
jgi:hypothetical protein